jgi:rod shape determining protein RodA
MRPGAPSAVIEAVDSRARGLRSRRVERVHATAAVWRLDWILLGTAAAIVGYGLWVIAGITRHDVPGNSDYYLVRQTVFAVIGMVGLIGMVLVDPDWLRRYKRVIYGGTTGLMLIVLLGGAVTRGSKRWLDLGFFRFQPSEFGKLAFVLFLAAFLADRGKRVSQSQTVLTTLGFATVPVLLVFMQPDFGTAMVYTAAVAGVLFVAGTRWTHLAVLGALTVLAAMLVLWLLPAAGVHVLKPYQEKRLTGFTHPDQDPSGSTYNVRQSINAVGAGGWHGRGIEQATQTKLNFLPEHATDFVFASLAEQRGFVGVAILLLLYLLVVWRGLKIVAGARDAFCAIAAGGIVVALLFQVFVNVGMTIGIAPITGIPLPMVSVGGSSMIANLLAIGVLEAIHARGRPRRRPV